MGWRDFLYYQRGEKIGIIMLVLLISIVMLFNLILAKRKPTQVIINQNDSLIAAFDSFYNSIEVNNKRGSYASSSNGNVVINNSNNNQLKTTKEINPVVASNNVFAPTEKLNIGDKIYLNNSDTTDWKKVPGIGSSFASRIVKYRNLLGGYADIEQLKEVYGMDEERYFNMLPYIEFDSGHKKININKLEFKELLRHPYLTYDQVKSITNLRKKKGDIYSIKELSVLNEFTDEDLLRLEAYVEF